MSNNNKVGVGFGVMILNSDGQVLLGKRHENPEKADSELHGEGSWTMPGGKLHFGESFEDAAYREVLEETGIRITKDRLRFISLSNDIVSDAHFVTLGFLSEDFEGKPQVMEPDEIIEWKWFSLDGLPSPMYFPSRSVIMNYLAKKVY